MSDTQRPKTAGDKMSADEVNKDLPILLNAGETINGATLPVAVYVHTDGELYACDGNDTAKLNFIGFAVSNSTDGNPIQLQNHGVVSGFTGLTIGSKYYVQDDGSINTTEGTYSILVGKAISATQILIQIISETQYIPTDDLLTSADTERTVVAQTSETFELVKAIQINKKGKIRVKFDMHVDATYDGNVSGLIYINGVVAGTKQSNSSHTYITYSEDLYVRNGDVVQLYLTRTQGGASGTGYCENFRIYGESIVSYFNNIIITN